MTSWVAWLLAAVAVAVVVPFVDINVVRDDAPARVACGTADDGWTASGPGAGDVSVDDVDGTWVVAEGSEVGYRVVEVLFGQDTEGVGRTSAVCAQGDSSRIVGSIDVVFADHGIPQPDVPGITTRDHGLLELDLRLARSG